MLPRIIRVVRTGLVRNRYVSYLRVLAACAPAHSAACLLLAVVAAAAVGLGIVGTGRLIATLPDGATAGADSLAAASAWRWLLVVVLAFVIAPVATAVASSEQAVVSARFLRTFHDLVADASTGPYEVGHLEDDGRADRLADSVAATRHWLFMAGLDGTWGLLQRRLAAVATFVIVANWRWWVPCLLVLA